MEADSARGRMGMSLRDLEKLHTVRDLPKVGDQLVAAVFSEIQVFVWVCNVFRRPNIRKFHPS